LIKYSGRWRLPWAPSPAADGPGLQEAAPPVNGVVATPRPLAAAMLGPLIAPGSRFLELLIIVDV
jgi:hypothetical protein